MKLKLSLRKVPVAYSGEKFQKDEIEQALGEANAKLVL